MKILTLPPKTKKLIDNYLNLKANRRKIVCPYYQNVLKKTKSPVYSGKGRPKEIETEITKIIKVKPQLESVNYDAFRLNLVEIGLGIDCSGFVTNVLNQFFLEKHNQSLFRIINTKGLSLPRRLIFKLRPRTNLSAHTLTTKPISKKISLNQTRPGDLFKLGKGHVAIIIKTWKKENQIKKLEYAHSTSDYGIQYGVRQGQIVINKPNQALENQLWKEIYQGKNWTKKDYLNAATKNRGFRRIINDI